MDRGKNFLELFPNESQNSPLLFCAYRKMGLLCWSAAQPNQLRFIAAFATNPAISTSSTQLDQNALFKLITVRNWYEFYIFFRPFHCLRNFPMEWNSPNCLLIAREVGWLWWAGEWYFSWRWTRTFGIDSALVGLISTLPLIIYDRIILQSIFLFI